MNYRYLIGCLLCISTAFSAAVCAQEEMRVTVETNAVSNSVSGPGFASSTLTDAGSYTNVFSLNSSSSSEKAQFSFDMGARYTNDLRTDPSMYSMTGLRMRMSNSGRTLNLGDTFESFSQYSMSSGIKGLSYKINEKSLDAPEMTFLYGYAYPRWDGFNSSDNTKSIKRTVFGTRAKKSFSPFFTAGLSFVKADDSDRVSVSDTLYDVNSYALDWEYKPFSDLSIRGESCLASTTLSPGGGLDNEENGRAHRVIFDGNTGIVRLNAEYERVSPGFYSTMGSATRDREKAKVRWSQKLSPNKSVNYGVLWFRDNLSNNKAYTTQSFRPEIGYTFRNLFSKRYASADVKLMLDRRYGGASSVTNKYLTMGYRDRLGSFDADFNMGYTDYDSKLQSHNKELTYNMSFGSRTTRGNTVLRPTINIGGSTVNDELADLKDQIWNYALGLVVEVPDKDFRSSFNIGRNRLNPGQGDDSGKWHGALDIRYSPKWLADYNAESLYVKAYVNRYTYSVDTNNFRETGVIGGLNLLY